MLFGLVAFFLQFTQTNRAHQMPYCTHTNTYTHIHIANYTKQTLIHKYDYNAKYIRYLLYIDIEREIVCLADISVLLYVFDLILF